jgi:hypothetical protein
MPLPPRGAFWPVLLQIVAALENQPPEQRRWMCPNQAADLQDNHAPLALEKQENKS